MRNAARFLSRWIGSDFALGFSLIQACLQFGDATELEVEAEDPADRLRLFRVHDQLSVFRVVAERYVATHPHAPAFGGGNLVSDPLAGDLAFELREGQEDVQGQPAHGRGGVELLGHGYEGRPSGVEGLDDLGEVGQAAGEAIDFVNHDGVDLLGRNVFEQLFERGPVHVSARVAAVVVASGNDSPALVALTQDESLAGFPLRIEGVEGLLQTFLTGLPRIDRTTNDRLCFDCSRYLLRR